MSKKFLETIDPSQEDGLSERIEKEEVSKKYFLFFTASLISLWLAFILNVFMTFGSEETPPARLFSVKKKGDGFDMSQIAEVPRTLPTAHHTFKNVSSWVKDAIGETYSLGFSNFDKQVVDVEKYFTTEGYESYKKALVSSKVEANVKNKKIEISILPLKEPVLINSGVYNETEFWRFRTKVLISYFGGKEPVRQKYYLEMLVRRVPSYVSSKSLAIHEYVMLPI